MLWTAALDPGGYGRFWCPGFPSIDGGPKAGCMVKAHRVGLLWLFGPEILYGLDGDHLCRRKACVNPLHVMGATRSENVRRGNFARRVRFRPPGLLTRP